MRSNAEIGLCFKMPLQLLQAQMGPAARCSICMCLYLWDLSTICTKCCWRLLTLQTASNSFKQLQRASNSEHSSAAVLSTTSTGARWAWSGQTRPSSKLGEYLAIVTTSILNTLQYILIAEARMFEGLQWTELLKSLILTLNLVGNGMKVSEVAIKDNWWLPFFSYFANYLHCQYILSTSTYSAVSRGNFFLLGRSL